MALLADLAKELCFPPNTEVYLLMQLKQLHILYLQPKHIQAESTDAPVFQHTIYVHNYIKYS